MATAPMLVADRPHAVDAVNILVVDDQPDKILVFRTILDELGENIVTASSGSEALKRMLEYEFAVVLLDVNMPEMDGFETAALIRGRKRFAHTPIIFVTAYQDEMHAAAGYSLGAVDFILTPLVPEVLRSKVRVFAQLYRMRNQIARQADERIAFMREQAARAVAEESIRRSTLLAEVSQVLSSSLDPTDTVKRLTRFVVPALGELCAMALVDDAGAIRETHATWIDRRDESTHVEHACARHVVDARLAAALERAIADGVATREDLGATRIAVAVGATDGDASAAKRADGVRHLVTFPLCARGRQLGAIMFGSADEPSAADFALAGDVAGRAAVALDNGLLYAKVQEADQRKDEFLAMLAHELRNPLAPIRVAVAVLRRTIPQVPVIQRTEDIIDRQVEHLTRMVDDLLDVSRLTQGKIRLDRVPVELATTMERAVETVRPDVMRRRHELHVELPPAPLVVHGDPIRLTQIFSNLLNNACKYTAEGGEIRFTAERVGAQAVVRVCDNGSGIPADVLPHVFDLFRQANRSLARSEGGLGIGLTVVRSLVEKHDGTVEARSDGVGHGSELVVRLPLLEGVDSVGADAPAVEARAVSRACRILVVDDNVDSSEALDLLLRLDGHDVRQAADGSAALEIARDFQPHLVLCDIGLPGMDGFDVIRALREQSGEAMPVVAALTGYARSTDRERIRDAGFAYHLVKPVNVDDLRALVAAHQPSPDDPA
jgi:signal transduction histidine kinase/DNA-binding response OmpR family regulator